MIKCISVKGLKGDVRNTQQRVSWAKNPRLRANRLRKILVVIFVTVGMIIAFAVRDTTPKPLRIVNGAGRLISVRMPDGKIIRDSDQEIIQYMGRGSLPLDYE
jgi:hypothetical protein